MAYGLGVLSEHWGSREGMFRGCTHATYCAVYFERISGQEKPENIDLAEAKASVGSFDSNFQGEIPCEIDID